VQPTIVRLLILCALVLLLAPAAHAKRVALLIGNAAYSSEKPLANPIRDARLLARVLKDDLKFDDVKLAENVGRARLIELIDQFQRQAASAEAAVFYFSGHGMQDGGKRNFLIPVDAHISGEVGIRAYGVQADEVVAALASAAPRVSVIILDACRDNPYAGATRSGTKGLARIETHTDQELLIAYATRDGQVALDGKGNNSPYAAALAKHLRQAGQKPLLSLFDQVADQVRAETGNQQRPTRYGDLKASTYLLANLTVQPPAPDLSRVNLDDLKYQQTEQGHRQAEAEQAAAARRPTPAAVDTKRAGQTFKDCPECPEMVVIPAGRFEMGSNEIGYSDEQPVHTVSVPMFALAKTEVTQGQWQALMGTNPSYFKTCDDCPVEQVSWDDAQTYVRKLSARTGQHYRLPSESEWEYACRAGDRHEYCGGDSLDRLDSLAWDTGNSNGRTQPVARKQANAFGLYDMNGNVWEWVEDCWNGSYSGAPTDGSAWTSGRCSLRVQRGGAWDSRPAGARAAYRFRNLTTFQHNNRGFRPARIISP